MSTKISLTDAEIKLRELIDKLAPGAEIVITENEQPLAKLTRQKQTHWPCQPGTARETRHWMAPDFDAPLDNFQDSMQ